MSPFKLIDRSKKGVSTTGSATATWFNHFAGRQLTLALTCVISDNLSNIYTCVSLCLMLLFKKFGVNFIQVHVDWKKYVNICFGVLIQYHRLRFTKRFRKENTNQNLFFINQICTNKCLVPRVSVSIYKEIPNITILGVFVSSKLYNFKWYGNNWLYIRILQSW